MSGGDLEAVARRAARGDARAFEALCRALQDDIWRYCYALTGERELAFDAAQETFVRAVTAIRRFRGDAPVRVWLLRLARRSCGQVLRSRRRRPDVVAGEATPEVAVADSAGRVEAEQLIAGLPTELRQAFVLTQLLGLSYEQAARVAACPVGTIRSRVYRARERLVAAFRADGADDDDEEESDACS